MNNIRVTCCPQMPSALVTIRVNQAALGELKASKLNFHKEKKIPTCKITTGTKSYIIHYSLTITESGLATSLRNKGKYFPTLFYCEKNHCNRTLKKTRWHWGKRRKGYWKQNRRPQFQLGHQPQNTRCLKEKIQNKTPTLLHALTHFFCQNKQ